MKKQAWINRHLGKHLSADKEPLKSKTHLFKVKTFIQEIFQKKVPENIDEIEDKTKVLIIHKEPTLLDKIKSYFSKKKAEKEETEKS